LAFEGLLVLGFLALRGFSWSSFYKTSTFLRNERCGTRLAFLTRLDYCDLLSRFIEEGHPPSVAFGGRQGDNFFVRLTSCESAFTPAAGVPFCIPPRVLRLSRETRPEPFVEFRRSGGPGGDRNAAFVEEFFLARGSAYAQQTRGLITQVSKLVRRVRRNVNGLARNCDRFAASKSSLLPK